MEETIQLIKNFEKRNNISIAVTIYSDESSCIEEFWDNEILNQSKTIKELQNFLKNTQYLLTGDGRCVSPVQIV